MAGIRVSTIIMGFLASTLLLGCAMTGDGGAKRAASGPSNKSANYTVTFFNSQPTITLNKNNDAECMYKTGPDTLTLKQYQPVPIELEDNNNYGDNCWYSRKLVSWSKPNSVNKITFMHQYGSSGPWTTQILDGTDLVKGAICVTDDGATLDCLTNAVPGNVVAVDITL